MPWCTMAGGQNISWSQRFFYCIPPHLLVASHQKPQNLLITNSSESSENDQVKQYFYNFGWRTWLDQVCLHRRQECPLPLFLNHVVPVSVKISAEQWSRVGIVAVSIDIFLEEVRSLTVGTIFISSYRI